MRRQPWLAVLLAGCGVIEVRMAFVPDGGPPLDQSQPCATDDQCDRDAYCERACGASVGVCTQRPVLGCAGNQQQVCGCDGVNYVTDCSRIQAQAQRASFGECPSPRRCDDANPCPPPATCAHLTDDNTCSPARGVCWYGPPHCSGLGSFVDCADAGLCLDACAAMADGRPFRSSPTGGCP
jgi:hypothetical protein